MCWAITTGCGVAVKENISFWDDRWVGNQSFKSLFPALFALAVDNKAKVSESYIILDDGHGLCVMLLKLINI